MILGRGSLLGRRVPASLAAARAAGISDVLRRSPGIGLRSVRT
jgi:hypothetical protein